MWNTFGALTGRVWYTVRIMARWGSYFDVAGECRMLKVPFWQCPPFLFLLMGLITIVSMVATYLFASRYTVEPEVAALIVIFVAVLLFVVGNLVISGFDRIVDANRTKSEFISIVSHQLGTPLSIFKMTLELVQREMRGASPPPVDAGGAVLERIASLMTTLGDTTEGMIGLVHSLLEVSRIEARSIVLKSEIFSLNELTRKIVESRQRYTSASNVRIVLDLDGALPGISADQDRMAMVVQNLVDNAIRYTASGSTVAIVTVREDGNVRWSITDQGIGIPEAAQRFIFQKFFRAENGASRETHGSGIGLYIAKAIVDASGGAIGFKSQEHEGSTFWFTLPAAKSEDNAAF